MCHSVALRTGPWVLPTLLFRRGVFREEWL